MIITKEIMEAGKSSRGGWNLKQVQCLGFPEWRKGWMHKVIGMNVEDDVVKLFISLKNLHLHNKEVISKERRKKVGSYQFEPVNTNIAYTDQYKHPNWQRLRLEVLKRDKFKCINCYNPHKTLHAHHLKYIRGKFIWEVPHWYIVTLCEDCHSAEHSKDLTIGRK